MSKLLKVFVYGTLKIGGRFAGKFDDLRVSSKPGTVQGTMFSINRSFPGLVLDGDTNITGEVHEYKEGVEVEKALDRIEGYMGEDEPSNLYNKATVEVKTTDGIEKCKVYIFARETERFSKVAGGEWEL